MSLDIPEDVKVTLWDVDTGQLDFDQRSGFVIERLMEFGGDEAIRWMLGYYSQQQLEAVLEQSRQISAKTANYWVHYFGISQQRVSCFQIFSPPIKNPFWPH